MDSCIFCKIIKGELPSYKIHENDKFFAFLSIGPIKEGHALVIPKVHVDDFFDMDEALLSKILTYSKSIANTLKKAFNPKSGKIGLIVAGLEVPHAHLHLIPMDDLRDLSFDMAKKVSSDELQEDLEKIKGSLGNKEV